ARRVHQGRSLSQRPREPSLAAPRAQRNAHGTETRTDQHRDGAGALGPPVDRGDAAAAVCGRGSGPFASPWGADDARTAAVAEYAVPARTTTGSIRGAEA